jgi:hypothetical protein
MFSLSLCVAVIVFMVFGEFENLRKQIDRLASRVYELEEKLHLHDKDEF